MRRAAIVGLFWIGCLSFGVVVGGEEASLFRGAEQHGLPFRPTSLSVAMVAADAGTDSPRYSTEKVAITRDLTQTDRLAKLPDGGANCCGPVAISNSMFALAALGHPRLVPDLPCKDEAHRAVARTLAADAYTAAGSRRGTNVARMIRGANRYVSEQGYTARFEFQGWRTVADEYCRGQYPDPKWIADPITYL